MTDSRGRSRYTYYDADGDAWTAKRYRWYEDDVVQAAYDDLNPLPASATTPGEIWKVGVAVRDTKEWGAEALASVMIGAK